MLFFCLLRMTRICTRLIIKAACFFVPCCNNISAHCKWNCTTQVFCLCLCVHLVAYYMVCLHLIVCASKSVKCICKQFHCGFEEFELLQASFLESCEHRVFGFPQLPETMPILPQAICFPFTNPPALCTGQLNLSLFISSSSDLLMKASKLTLSSVSGGGKETATCPAWFALSTS